MILFDFLAEMLNVDVDDPAPRMDPRIFPDRLANELPAQWFAPVRDTETKQVVFLRRQLYRLSLDAHDKHDDGDIRILLLEVFADFDPVSVREHEKEDNKRRELLVQRVLRLGPAFRQNQLKSIEIEIGLEHQAQDDKQNGADGYGIL